MAECLRVALAGNPNCGKSTIFNALTGARQHVGNWPGKTVEKKEGNFKAGGVTIEMVDLPGTYSLSPYSQEEVIARDYILEQQPDVIVSVIDSSNLERNLYLTTQLMELGKPVLIALNMMDLAQSRGIQVDEKALSKELAAPVTPMVANEGKGIDELVANLLKAAGKDTPDAARRAIALQKEVEIELAALQKKIMANPALKEKYPPRWLALRLLENDSEVISKVEKLPGAPFILDAARLSLQNLTPLLDEGDFETLVADRRYTYINELVRRASRRSRAETDSFSDRLDVVLTHRIAGIPIFLALMWVVFKLTTDVAGPFVDWVDGVIAGPITKWVLALLSAFSLSGTWVESLAVDGVIAGVGGVLVFVPVLMALYLALAVLEDSGYMARAAFIMDRLMHAMGLHGKSFLPMIVGFGCTVPAFYATRTLENERDRILTGLLVPFMSCGARLPVYVLFAAIFFPENAGVVIFSLYILGIVVAILIGIILRKTVFKGSERSPFVMELPPYRLPTLKGIWFHMWERTSSFVRKAWTLILTTSALVWLLLATPIQGGSFAAVGAADSAFAGLSKAAAPLFQPAGFASWEASGALVTGFVAKEVVVATLSQTYGLDEEASEEPAEPTTFLQDLGGIGSGFLSAAWNAIKAIPGIVGINLAGAEEETDETALSAAITDGFNASSGGHGAAAALAYLVFVLLYTPCMVAVAAERQELGMKWTWVSIIGQFAIAWIFAVVVFQAGRLLGF